MTHERAGRLAEAAACYASAAALMPDWADPHANLGNALRKLGRLADAEPHLRRALALRPDHAKANNFLGIVLLHTGRPAQAVGHFRRAIEVRQEDPEAHNNLGVALTQLGDAAGAIAAFRRAVDLRPDPYAHSALLFTMHYDPALATRAIYEEHLRWAARYAPPAGRAAYANDRSPGRRLRLGYVSADLREHTRARYVEPVLANHDRGAFEVLVYSDVRRPDAVTDRLRRAADVWRETHALDDVRLADRIRSDAVDVLVDLTGHMAGHRLLAFARRPAPVQVAYPGYPNTTGLAAVDYCVTDADRDPAPAADALYAERLLRLATTSQAYQPTDADLAVGPPPFEAAGRITFASLNKPIKANPGVLRTWARLLDAVPGARLLLLSVGGDGDAVLRDRCAAAGIAGNRLELAPRLPRRGYLESHRRVDVNLDPWPYNGHTTLLDGLWMGVPAVALEGDAHVSREGAAALRLVSLADLVARSPGEYVAVAARLAGDRPRLRELRRTLRGALERSALADGRALTRRLEAVYRDAWRRWVANGA